VQYMPHQEPGSTQEKAAKISLNEKEKPPI
jgi:hypothetical protein